LPAGAVFFAFDGYGGYEQAINLSPDIILMDVSIHGFSGIELSNLVGLVRYAIQIDLVD